VEVAGVEPCELKTQVTDNQNSYVRLGVQCAQIDSQGFGSDEPDLARIVACWALLPATLKAAILAIVDSV